MSLRTICEPVQDDLVKVAERLRLACEVSSPWLAKVSEHYLMNSGERIPSALVLLSGKAYCYDLSCLLPAAVAIEIMHAATLVHEDATAKSLVRCGRPTINSVWGQDKAILVGDYLLAKATDLADDAQSLRVITLFAQTFMTISSAELSRVCNAFNLEQTRQQYLEMISGKTASLLSLATASGGILGQAPEKSVKALHEYGHNLGVSLQIVDDILDFVGNGAEMGKPRGSALAEGSLTLPGILLLERYPDDNPIRRLFENEGDKQENIRLAIELVCNSPVIRECYEVASGYCVRACRNLELLSGNAIGHSLEELANYVVTRKE